jgi:hypothetical protein
MITDERIIEEAVRLVEDGVCVTLPVDGNSMLPFIIGGKESVILQQSGEPKVGDVVLAWVEKSRAGAPAAVSHLYVVHRIIRIDGDHVTLMGDGNIAGTEHCLRSAIKARVTHVVDENERTHDIYSWWRKLAARLWFWLRPVRRYLLAIYRRVKR